MPRLVLVSGPAGVGKSRLGWEFEKYIDGLAEQVWWHRGRCLSYGEGVAFWALAEIVRQRLGIAEEDPAEVAAAKLAAGLDRFVPDPGERAYVGVRLGRLLGVAVAGDGGERAGAGRSCSPGGGCSSSGWPAEQPVVLLVEDAQYADAGLLDFLDHLIDWARDLPIYRAGVRPPRAGPGAARVRHRPQPHHADPRPAGSRRRWTRWSRRWCPGCRRRRGRRSPAQAQGIPLFAVETVRSLIDRDIVQPVEGVYRLVGDVGELAVPDSLHALLAARLDALDPDVRRLVADAAVLGTTFPAEALVAVSGQDEAAVRAALAELVRREVLSVSADPLSPERGSYRFAQNMLRQVAYDTLSRRDRKARHLAVAAHLRAAFPGDGEEVADVIARHYLDALDAVPDDPDAGADPRPGDRGADPGRRARRAHRRPRRWPPPATPPPPSSPRPSTAGGQHSRRRARCGNTPPDAAVTNADWAAAVEQAGRAGGSATGRAAMPGRPPAPRRSPGRRCAGGAGTPRRASSSPPPWRCCGQNPDTDTVQALGELAALEVFAGSHRTRTRCPPRRWPSARPSAVDDATLADLFTTRGIYLASAGRRPRGGRLLPRGRPARRAGRRHRRPGTRAAQPVRRGHRHRPRRRRGGGPHRRRPPAPGRRPRPPRGRGHEPGPGAADARRLGHRRSRTGPGRSTPTGWPSIEYLACYRAWLAALRGDTPTAQAILAGLGDLRASEDPQDQAVIAVVEAFTAAARGQPADALRHARATLDHAGALGISHEYLRWAWPLAARAAHDLSDTATAAELLALLDGYQPGQLAPMLRAERDLARARLAAADGDPEAGTALRRRDHRPAPALHPLPPRPRPARPRRPPAAHG